MWKKLLLSLLLYMYLIKGYSAHICMSSCANTGNNMNLFCIWDVFGGCQGVLEVCHCVRFWWGGKGANYPLHVPLYTHYPLSAPYNTPFHPSWYLAPPCCPRSSCPSHFLPRWSLHPTTPLRPSPRPIDFDKITSFIFSMRVKYKIEHNSGIEMSFRVPMV
jgi:hypothetical protein